MVPQEVTDNRRRPTRRPTTKRIGIPVCFPGVPVTVLATKLHIPAYRSDFVERTVLVDRLVRGLERKLTLVCAPAGYGKTTLVSELVRRLVGTGESQDESIAVAWLSLDPEDGDTARFVAHLGAAVSPALGGDPAGDRSPDPGEIVASILNRASERSGRIMLVLDDYHVLESVEVDSIVAALVERMPSQLHLVKITREDHALPLARLRANNEVTDVRAADLRFTAEESRDLLERTMGLSLTDGQLTDLGRRTEGWAAALNLAALSLQSAHDIDAAITSITGSHRHVADYLVEEVLARQDSDVRELLLRTSILVGMTAPLCDTLTDRTDSQSILERLNRANVFTVALDDERVWFRYHQLFADLLRVRTERSPDSPLPGTIR